MKTILLVLLASLSVSGSGAPWPRGEIRAACQSDGLGAEKEIELMIILPAGYYDSGMAYLKTVSFDYETKALAVQTKPGTDQCHAIGQCSSYLALPYQEGKWAVSVDGNYLGQVTFGARFDGDTRTYVRSCNLQAR